MVQDLGVFSRTVHWDDWDLDVAPPPQGFRPGGDAAWAADACRATASPCLEPEGDHGTAQVVLARVRTPGSGEARADGSIAPMVDGPTYLLVSSSQTWSPGPYLPGMTGRAAPTFGTVTWIHLIDASTGTGSLSMSSNAPPPDLS